MSHLIRANELEKNGQLEKAKLHRTHHALHYADAALEGFGGSPKKQKKSNSSPTSKNSPTSADFNKTNILKMIEKNTGVSFDHYLIIEYSDKATTKKEVRNDLARTEDDIKWKKVDSHIIKKPLPGMLAGETLHVYKRRLDDALRGIMQLTEKKSIILYTKNAVGLPFPL